MLPLLARALVLVAVGAGLGLGGNALRSDGVAVRGYSPPVSCAAAASAGAPAVEVLPPAEAARLCGEPGVLVADTRPPRRFAAGHVAEAVHLPCAEPDTEASGVVSRL